MYNQFSVTFSKNCGKVFQFELQRFCQVKQNDFQFNLTPEKPGFQ